MPLTALLSHIDRDTCRQARAAAGSVMARPLPVRDARICHWGGVIRHAFTIKAAGLSIPEGAIVIAVRRDQHGQCFPLLIEAFEGDRTAFASFPRLALMLGATELQIGLTDRTMLDRISTVTAAQLHSKVQNEIARQRIAANALPNDEYEAWEAKVRRKLRADAVFALAFRSDRVFAEAEDRRQGIETPMPSGPRRDLSGLGALVGEILDGWSAWHATLGKPEGNPETDAAYERACDHRDDLLDAAEALPATPDSLVAKALAVAWLEFVSEDRPGLRRSERSFTGRITLDIQAAIVGTPKAQASADDAALIALEAEFLATDTAFTAAALIAGEAWSAYAKPPMPRELRVWGNDWIYKAIPQTRVVERNGAYRTEPYGEQEVEQMRGIRCLRRSYGQTGELQPNGTRAISDTMAQERVDSIVAAWDRWQAQITEAKATVRLTELEVAREEARKARDAVLQRVRETTASGLAGLAIKARIAANMMAETDPKASALSYDADDSEGLLLDLAGDVLALTGGLPSAHRLND